MRMRFGRVGACLLVLSQIAVVAGCPSSRPVVDASDVPAVESGVDAGIDARVDTGLDSAVDTGVDTGVDIVAPKDSSDVAACTNTMCGTACVDTQTAVGHCGDCATDCTTLANVAASVTCAAGECVVTGHCAAGFGDCDGDPTNGCETDVTTASNCGSCGTACAEPTPMCSMGTGGTYACVSGCSGGTPTRCSTMCVNTTTNPAFCGNCTTACPAAANATPTCASSTCGFSCNANFGDCDGSTANGCETSTDTNTAHCGGCANVCPTSAFGTATCVAGVCGLNCSSGHHLCGSTCAANTDVASCGALCTAGRARLIPNETATPYSRVA